MASLGVAFGSNQSGTVPYSNETAERMDREAKSIVDEAYRRTISLVEERKEELVKVAEMLIEKETISHDDVFELIGARGFAGESDAAYQEFVHSTSKFGGGELQLQAKMEAKKGATGIMKTIIKKRCPLLI